MIDRSAMPPDDPIWQAMINTGRLEPSPVRYLTVTESTNTVAMDLGLAGAPAGTLVIAETQTGGRGRLGRAWLSPTGAGLYFSLILRPRLDLAELPKITLAAGVAVCRGIEVATGLAPTIKWPNDLLLRGRKFAGILTETAPLPARGRPLVVLGIGINVCTAVAQFPAVLRDKVTSLAIESGATPTRGSLLAAVVDEITRTVSEFEHRGFARLKSEFDRRDFTRGRSLAWVTPAGGLVAGVGLGIDDQGLLHIRDATGQVHAVLSGDVTLAVCSEGQ